MTGQTTIDALMRELCAEGAADDDLLARLAELLPKGKPEAGARSRLLSTISRGGRLHRFAVDVARMLDISEDEARVMLDNIDKRDSWEPGSFGEAVTLYHVDGGAKVQGAITGFVRVPPGQVFPEHTHTGPETVLIVQGRARDSRDGTILAPGDIGAISPSEGAHEIEAMPGPPLIYLAVVFEGIKVGDRVFTPDSYDM